MQWGGLYFPLEFETSFGVHVGYFGIIYTRSPDHVFGIDIVMTLSWLGDSLYCMIVMIPECVVEVKENIELYYCYNAYTCFSHSHLVF